MLGLKIAATGLIVAMLSAWLIPDGAMKRPEPGFWATLLAIVCVISIAAMPIGLIVAIWV